MRTKITARQMASLALPLLTASCAAQARVCLQTPVTSKVSTGALETCEQALRADLNRRDVFHRLVNLLRVRGRHDVIVQWSGRVLAHDDGRTDALYHLAYGLRKIGDVESALRKYKEYANKNRDDPDPYFGMALCHQALGNAENAIDAFQLYLEKERRRTQRPWVDLARARIAALKGEPAGAHPAVPGVLQDVSGELKPPASAAPSTAALAPTVGVHPGPASAAPPIPSAPPVAAAAPVPSAGSSDCAVHERAFKADPFNTDAYDRFGDCALAAGRHDDVLRAMRIATRDNPEFVRGLLHMGRALKAKGMPDRARGYLSKACNSGVPAACGQ